MADTTTGVMQEVVERIRELRLDCGYTEQQMAESTGFSLEDYRKYESGGADLPFSFIHKCAMTFGVEMMELLEGAAPRLTSYTVTRRGGGQLTSQEPGTEIRAIAPLFKNRKADPYWVRYEYSEAEQNAPIHQNTHGGQEFDLIMEGRLKVKIGEHTEVLGPGDSIFYNSSTPHGMIAVDGTDCVFCAVILPDEEGEAVWEHGRLHDVAKQTALPVPEQIKPAPEFMAEFIRTEADENGTPRYISFTAADKFNFAFDVVDAIAAKEPQRLAMVHLDREKHERRFTFEDMRKMRTGSSGRSSSGCTSSARSRSPRPTSFWRRILNTASSPRT